MMDMQALRAIIKMLKFDKRIESLIMNDLDTIESSQALCDFINLHREDFGKFIAKYYSELEDML